MTETHGYGAASRRAFIAALDLRPWGKPKHGFQRYHWPQPGGRGHYRVVLIHCHGSIWEAFVSFERGSV
jgi:hypothetical protein